MIKTVNEAWGWTGVVADTIVLHNDFGNIVFKTSTGEYWRLCPEELSHDKIASNDSDWLALKLNPEFVLDWQMTRLVEIAKERLGALESGKKYNLKFPAVLGGAYKEENIVKISFLELISISGYLANQIRFLKDGQKVVLSTNKKSS